MNQNVAQIHKGILSEEIETNNGVFCNLKDSSSKQMIL